MRVIIHAVAFVFALGITGLIPVAADALCLSQEDEHEDDCSDCGHDCPPGCPDCHCAFPSALAVIAAGYEAVAYATSIEFANISVGVAPAPAGAAVYRPPRV